MTYANALNQLLAIETSDSPSGLEAALLQLLKPLGFDRFVLASVAPSAATFVDRIYLAGGWEGEIASPDRDRYLLHCPITRHILNRETAFFWSKTEGEEARYRIVTRPRGPGLHGLQVPVYGRTGLEGAASFAGRSIDSGGRTRLLLQAAGTIGFQRALTLSATGRAPELGGLTAREIEVLSWMAAGRRIGEVANALGLSERTVENHLRRIRLRLGARTTAEAVRIATQRGAMSMDHEPMALTGKDVAP